MNENKKNYVFIYANRLNTTRDAFPEILTMMGGGRREYIVNSPAVIAVDVNRDVVKNRLKAIFAGMGDYELPAVVLAGYSPLVAIVHEVAKELGIPEVFFIRDEETRQFAAVWV